MNKESRQAEKTADLEAIGKLIDRVNKLSEAGLMWINPKRCTAAFNLDCWKNADQTFKEEWCENMLTYWCIQKGLDTRYQLEMDIYSLEVPEKKLIGKFTMKGGFVPALTVLNHELV